MEIKYKITEISITEIDKYPWIKSNFEFGEIGTWDNREVVRLLENSHYDHIANILRRLDKYGELSDEIGEQLLYCNDIIVFDRFLAELNLFIHLYERIPTKIKAIRRIKNQKTADFSIMHEKMECICEVYTPMDYFGYQTFSILLTSCIKNLNFDKGFNITIDSDTEHFFYTNDFPPYKEIYKWLSNFQTEFVRWIIDAKEGDKHKFISPAKSVNLIVKINSIEPNPDARRISWFEGTRSTDSIWFFRIKDPVQFSKTQWGNKIKDKLIKQQAGLQSDKVFRILFLNLSKSETSDLSFINDINYLDKISKNIQYLASDIEPYPPYDIVLLCELGFECGFSEPIKLSNHDDKLINDLLSKSSLDIPIRKIQKSSEEETQFFFEQIKKAIVED